MTEKEILERIFAALVVQNELLHGIRQGISVIANKDNVSGTTAWSPSGDMENTRREIEAMHQVLFPSTQ